MLRPHYFDNTGDVTYTVINPGGAYLGADAYDIDLQLDEAAALTLTTQSATKVYRTPQGPATQDMRVRLAAGSVLENLPDQLIVYRDGSYRQRSHVEMHPTASLMLGEIVTPGWSPDGAAFAYQELRMRTQIDITDADASRIFAVDQLRILPDPTTEGIGVMEGHTHAGMLLVADARVDDELIDELAARVQDAAGDHVGPAAVSRVGAPDPSGRLPMSGFVVRSLGDRTQDLADLHLAIVDLLRERWRGRPPVHLRKY